MRNEASQKLKEHLEGFSKEVADMEKALKMLDSKSENLQKQRKGNISFFAPETLRFTYKNVETNVSLFAQGLEAHKRRLGYLQSVANGQTLSDTERDELLKIKELADIPELSAENALASSP